MSPEVPQDIYMDLQALIFMRNRWASQVTAHRDEWESVDW